jgi:hypothetical protein
VEPGDLPPIFLSLLVEISPVCYPNVAIEILADNAAPEAEAVYGALGMPFSGLVFGLRQYFSRS